jgi:uroporphyrin-III C-methyltransferase
MKNEQQIKKVIIAGAGPGDPELITVKASRWLSRAEVVLTDRLVSEEIIRTWVPAGAEIIYVGKQCRRGASTPQETINALMVFHALQGKQVVRLKGGDASLFSNILDELITLKQHGIPFEIIPGISAAMGAAATAAIPLTARNYSTAVRFLTFYKSEVLKDEQWKELASTEDTLVFYMSSETLPGIVDKLLGGGASPQKMLAVVEQATTPFQNVYTTSLNNFHQQLGAVSFVSPSLVIIGSVVSLHEQFSWIENSNSKEPWFKPVAKLYTSIPDKTVKDKKHATRA